MRTVGSVGSAGVAGRAIVGVQQTADTALQNPRQVLTYLRAQGLRVTRQGVTVQVHGPATAKAACEPLVAQHAKALRRLLASQAKCMAPECACASVWRITTMHRETNALGLAELVADDYCVCDLHLPPAQPGLRVRGVKS